MTQPCLTLTCEISEKCRSSVYVLGDQEQLEFDDYVLKNTRKQQEGRKCIECLLCNKVTIHVGNMKQHFEVHHYRRVYNCPVCKRNCKTKNCLSVHRKNYGH